MAAAKKDQQDPDFETGLSRLESLVDALEAGELGLEEGVAHYQEGVELLAKLQQQLAGAETRVQELTEQLRGTVEDLEADDANRDRD